MCAMPLAGDNRNEPYRDAMGHERGPKAVTEALTFHDVPTDIVVALNIKDGTPAVHLMHFP
jgi:hypothetical protein